MFQLSNVLIIVGTDRNAGKTTFASRVIEQTAKTTPVNALKISPHFHELKDGEDVIFQHGNFVIAKEHDTRGTKDSNRFLKAGAENVYYMQVWDQDLLTAFKVFLKISGDQLPIVVESGWLRNIVIPGKFVIVNRKGNAEYKESIATYRQLPHVWTEFDGVSFDPSPDLLKWNGLTWE